MEEIETGVEELPIDSGPLGTGGDSDNDVDGPAVEVSLQNVLNVPLDGREKWGEASQLLYQPGYIHVLKQMALSGQMQMYNIRSVAWRLFLGCLPEEHSKWEEATRKSRERYNQLKKKHITDPHIASASLDVAINNPLSQAEDSPWHQFFQDNEMRQMINQDVVRTFPDVAFFKQVHIQERMLDLLFIYCKENPDLGYRQGMHEILAPIMFVLHAEERDQHDSSLAPEVQIVMDSDYLEHDAYTIFAELMESMEQWYMSSALEVDYYRSRSQVNLNRKMQHDPRTQKPFERNEISASSAISRKLEKIHQVLLKRADEELFTHLNTLSIPAQTYGIRWIRLLFGREFPLPSVLELWDALFADGPSLALMDYICVAMLMHIREVLIEGDYSMCMQHLMRFPAVYEVNYLVQRALHLRSPTQFPSPRIWTYHPSRMSKAQPPPSSAITQLLDDSFSAGTGGGGGSGSGGGGSGGISFKARAQQNTERIADFFQKAKLPKASSTSRQTARLEFQGSSSRSPSPTRKQDISTNNTSLTDEQLFSAGSASSSGSGSGKRMARFRILGDKHKNKAASSGDREMTVNPKARPVAEGSRNSMERLTSNLEDLDAKCLYCGGKMDTLITTLQTEIPEIPDLNPDTENTLFLAIAGLKQIRDLLLKKIPFSGDSTLGSWDVFRDTRVIKDRSDSGAQLENSTEAEESRRPVEEEEEGEGHRATAKSRTDSSNHRESDPETPELSISADGRDCTIEDDGTGSQGSACSMGDDWVNLSSSSHPLHASTD